MIRPRTDKFDPHDCKVGAYQVSLNLTELGDRAWEILKLAEQLEFQPPQFKTCPRFSGFVEVWAVILQQQHDDKASPDAVLGRWDEQVLELWKAIGQDSQFALVEAYSFEEYGMPREEYDDGAFVTVAPADAIKAEMDQFIQAIQEYQPK
jgi:hypothetical protein